MVSNNINGSENRSAGRDFNEGNVKVGQFIGRDVVNISITDSKDTDTEPLVPAQRKQLNVMAKEVAEASNEEGYIVWQRVHAKVGVHSINEITKEQYPVALGHLQMELDKLRNTSACKALMHQILKKTSKEEQRQFLYQYCDISFGSRRLTDLSKAQLQQALGWLCNEQENNEKLSRSNLYRFSIGGLLSNYPKELLVVLLIFCVVEAIFF